MTANSAKTVLRTGHVTWVISASRATGRTFGVYACGDHLFAPGQLPAREDLLFSGPVDATLPDELCALAEHIRTCAIPDHDPAPHDPNQGDLFS